MSERMTGVRLRNGHPGTGWQEYGRIPRDDVSGTDRDAQRGRGDRLMTEFVKCDECGGTIPADTYDQHGCHDPRNGPYDLDDWDRWVDDEEEERDA